MSRLFGSSNRQRGKSSRLTRWMAPPSGRLPPPLFDLRDRLAAAFSLDELKVLALKFGIETDNIPDNTRRLFALGLARAGWCRGCLGDVLGEAARQRPEGNWSLPALPPPPAERCEEDPLPRLSVFGDSRQVATAVLLLLLAAAAVAAGVRLARRPAQMTADFNIAVAAVNVDKLAGRADAAELGEMLQGQVVDIVAHQLDDHAPDETEVSGERMPIVTTSDQARKLAEQVNAQLVIYGRADLIDDEVNYQPRFYVALDTVRADVGEMQSVDELQGEAELGVPLSFPVKSLIEPKPPTDQTAAAATLLTDFVRALVNLNENEIDAAREHIEAAVDHTDRYVGIYGPFGGREVVYVFASHIARLQADQSPAGSAVRQSHLAAAEGHVMRALLDINPNYGRGFIALGNVQFEREMYGAALRTYAAAAALTKQPLDDLISLKATMGMANVNWEQLRVMPAGTPCAGEVGIWAGEAERHYSAVIAIQAAAASDDARLREMAARALTYRGEVHRFCGRTDAALADYRAALDLEPGPPLDGELRRLLVALTGEEE